MPVTSVLRVNGQFFAFVAETEGPDGKPRGCEDAPDNGRSDRGQQLPGAERAEGRRSARGVGRAEARRRRAHRPRRDRPWLTRSSDGRSCERVLAGDHPGGVLAIPTLPIAQFPDLAPPQVRCWRSTTARARRRSRPPSRHPSSRPSTACEGMALHDVDERRATARAAIAVTFDVGHAAWIVAAVDVQNRISQVAGPAAGRGPAAVGISVGEGRRAASSSAAGVSTRRTASTITLFLGSYIESSSSRTS